MSLKEPIKKLNDFHVCEGQVSLKKPLKNNLHIVQSWVSLKNIRNTVSIASVGKG